MNNIEVFCFLHIETQKLANHSFDYPTALQIKLTTLLTLLQLDHHLHCYFR